MAQRPKVFGAARAAADAKARDRDRGTAAQRGYGSRWARYSKWYRQVHAVCMLCEAEGISKLADVVDHIKPADKFPNEFWNPENHRSLCRRHNAEHAIECAKLYG
jgi:5-methylcytosine-specific restriction enzyme A